jgi:hypothetical protein
MRRVSRLRRSEPVGPIPQPCRAGLTFGGRPSGPLRLVSHTNPSCGRQTREGVDGRLGVKQAMPLDQMIVSFIHLSDPGIAGIRLETVCKSRSTSLGNSGCTFAEDALQPLVRMPSDAASRFALLVEGGTIAFKAGLTGKQLQITVANAGGRPCQGPEGRLSPKRAGDQSRR